MWTTFSPMVVIVHLLCARPWEYLGTLPGFAPWFLDINAL